MNNIHVFGQALAAAIVDRGGPQMEYLADDESLVFENGDLKQVLHLENFFRQHQGGRPVEAIADFFLQMRQEQTRVLDFETVRPLLHLHLVREDYPDEYALSRGAAPGLKQALILDYPEFVRFVVQADLEQIGQPEEVLWQIAAINTDAKMPEPKVQTLPNGKEALLFDCSMGAVYAWRYASTHGTAICGVPRRDFGVVTTDEDMSSFAMLGKFTFLSFREAEDHPLSPSPTSSRMGRLLV